MSLTNWCLLLSVVLRHTFDHIEMSGNLRKFIWMDGFSVFLFHWMISLLVLVTFPQQVPLQSARLLFLFFFSPTNCSFWFSRKKLPTSWVLVTEFRRGACYTSANLMALLLWGQTNLVDKGLLFHLTNPPRHRKLQWMACCGWQVVGWKFR